MPRFLLPSFAYNRPAILRSAWAKARALVVSSAKPCWPFPARPVTLRAAFAEALRDVWDLAKAERGYAVWCAEQDAGAATEAARSASLPTRERQIEDAQHALMMAEHNDTHGAHRLIAAARTRLASLQQPEGSP